jgi:hypothetical protein
MPEPDYFSGAVQIPDVYFVVFDNSPPGRLHRRLQCNDCDDDIRPFQQIPGCEAVKLERTEALEEGANTGLALPMRDRTGCCPPRITAA